MPLRVHCSMLLAVTALFCFANVLALPMDGLSDDKQCRCIHTTSDRINVRLFQSIEIMPAGPNCLNTEVIITLKDKQIVCVDPSAEWMQKYIQKVIKRIGTKK